MSVDEVARPTKTKADVARLANVSTATVSHVLNNVEGRTSAKTSGSGAVRRPPNSDIGPTPRPEILPAAASASCSTSFPALAWASSRWPPPARGRNRRWSGPAGPEKSGLCRKFSCCGDGCSRRGRPSGYLSVDRVAVAKQKDGYGTPAGDPGNANRCASHYCAKRAEGAWERPGI